MQPVAQRPEQSGARKEPAPALALDAPMSFSPGTTGASQQPASGNKPQIEALTALRFFAAASVVLYHTSVCIAPHNRWFGSLPLNQGVSFFFLLSGFILAYVYPELKGNMDVMRFYKARVARIWPTHVLVSVLFIAAFGVSLTAEPLAIAANLVMVQSIIPYKMYFSFINPPSWSVSTEFFFYLAFPLLLAGIKRRPFLVLSLTTVLLLGHFWLSSVLFHTMYVETMDEFWLLYVSPTCRVFEFVVGVLTCLVVSNQNVRGFLQRHNGWLALLVPAFIFGALHTPDLANQLHCPRGIKFWLGATGGVMPYVFLIAVASVQSGWLGRLLSNKTLVHLGHISYGMYLYHLPAYLLLTAQLHGALNGPVTYVVYWFLLVSLSDITFRFYEGPARKWLNGRFAR